MFEGWKLDGPAKTYIFDPASRCRDAAPRLQQRKAMMRSLSDKPWMLGSVSPLQMLRGMLDISVQWWREAPLLGAARLSLLAATIWGLAHLLREPGVGAVVAGAGALGLYALGRQ